MVLSSWLGSWVVALIVLGLAWPARATEPTLARLCFWVPPERMARFEAMYQEQLAPLLKQQGLVESAERGRTAVDSVFSRLFAVASPAAVAAKREALERDPAWKKALEHLNTEFEVTGADSPLRHEFTLYRSPAGAGTTVTAGPGSRHGLWLNINRQDGLPGSWVNSVLEDRAGLLWVAAGGAVTRYDGATFTTFTTADGLMDGEALSIFQDRAGRLWFGTDTGLSCYDGRTFTNYTRADGLAGRTVNWLLEDRAGRLWVGHWWDPLAKGVSCLEGGVFRTLTVADGLASNWVSSMLEDRAGNLWFGTDKGASRYDGKTFKTFTTADGLVDNVTHSMLQDRAGNLWFGTDQGVSRYDGKIFETVLHAPAGKAEYPTGSMVEDRAGNLWFGSFVYGAMRYDGREWVTFTAANGLPSIGVLAMAVDREGHVWVGTAAGGVSRYDGAQFTTFTTREGLPDSYVRAVVRDRRGHLWFGTRRGLARYDGKTFIPLASMDSLAGIDASALVEDGGGNLWYKEYFAKSGGAVRYDGKTFTSLTEKDGLAGNAVRDLMVDRKGDLWIASNKGVTKYDGQRCTNFSTKDGLGSDTVTTIREDQAGNLWFGTTAGASKYDGKGFTTFARGEGLGLDAVSCMAVDREDRVWFGGGWEDPVTRFDGNTFTTLSTKEGLPGGLTSMTGDRRGQMWFCAFGAGIARYDGRVFQYLTQRDGLVSDAVQSVYEDTLTGDFWIATDDGATRYRPSTTPPAIRIQEVIADRYYGPVQELSLPSSQSWIQFQFQGRSLNTPPDRMAYVYRLAGRDPDWRVTREGMTKYEDLPPGEYGFEVKAVDRDLNYSAPAQVKLVVHRPYGLLALFGGLGLALIGLVFASGYGIRRRRERDQARDRLMKEMEEELQTAHDLQMGLMPMAPPRIEGFEITGRCLPANHVGGDFFQYFPQDGQLLLCLADVTGHAMEAAIPMVMFSGILKTEIKYGPALERLFVSLNQTLYGSLEARTFVCFALGELALSTHLLRLSNSGCPYPYHYRAATGKVTELRVDAYPLGVRPDTIYRVIEIQLEPGDRVVFCSDGIIEAANAAGEMFGFERTAETIRKGCAENLSAEALLARIIGEVRGFRGETPQGDDQTVVVVKVEEQQSV